MKLDEQIFKSVFGRDLFFEGTINDKDLMATVALRYFLDAKGVTDSTNDYPFVSSEKGVTNFDCESKIKGLSAINEDDYYALLARSCMSAVVKKDGHYELSKSAKEVLYAIEVALELTAEEIGQRFDERDTVIAGAMFHLVERGGYCYVRNVDEEIIKQDFKEQMPEGNYKLAKTFVDSFEYAHKAITNQAGIIVSPKQTNKNIEHEG